MQEAMQEQCKEMRDLAREMGACKGMQGLGVILRPFGENLLQVGFVLEDPRESLVCRLRRSRVIPLPVLKVGPGFVSCRLPNIRSADAPACQSEDFVDIGVGLSPPLRGNGILRMRVFCRRGLLRFRTFGFDQSAEDLCLQVLSARCNGQTDCANIRFAQIKWGKTGQHYVGEIRLLFEKPYRKVLAPSHQVYPRSCEGIVKFAGQLADELPLFARGRNSNLLEIFSSQPAALFPTFKIGVGRDRTPCGGINESAFVTRECSGARVRCNCVL